LKAATGGGLPVLLKGPTGCGKTRFAEHMAWRLGRRLVTLVCHDDLSASNLTGRYLIRGGDTVSIDGRPAMDAGDGHDAAVAQYRLLAIEQAARIVRGSAAHAPSDADAAAGDLYNLREAPKSMHRSALLRSALLR
jgi:uncharacterized Zn-binding protein involved in type VI secretion